jgi:hypothetical protein
MGTISIHLAPELQQALGLNPSGQHAPTAVQIHPNPAEHASAGQDTVTLSPQETGSQQQNQQERKQSWPELVSGVDAQAPVQTAAPIFPAEAHADGTLQQVSPLAQLAASSAATAAGPSGATDVTNRTDDIGTADNLATADSGHQTPQQKLLQLDHTLRRLGINPQSISLANRMSMLPDANSPATLRAVVTEVRKLEQQAATAAVRNQNTAAADTPDSATSGGTAAQGAPTPHNGRALKNVLA